MIQIQDFRDVETQSPYEGVTMRVPIGPDDGAPFFTMRVFDVQPSRNSPHHQHWFEHEVFVHVGSCYLYAEQELFIGATHPVVRVAPRIPLEYRGGEWDFGWLLPRTDGHLARWLCDPYTLKFTKSFSRHAIRWFANIE